MCLILFAYRHHPQYPLVVAANRDEFFDRPTAPADFWEEAPDLLAGRDLRSGGTWLGITRTGRFSAVTNYRDVHEQQRQALSRGALTTDFLRSEVGPRRYLERLRGVADRYNGFNLLVGDHAALYHFSNREGVINPVATGVHGLSNSLLDTPWPKVTRGIAGLEQMLAGKSVRADDLFALLADDTPAPDGALPDTGIGQSWERVLSSLFIKSPSYGTRSSTVLLVAHDGAVIFEERTMATEGEQASRRRHTFPLQPRPEGAFGL